MEADMRSSLEPAELHLSGVACGVWMTTTMSVMRFSVWSKVRVAAPVIQKKKRKSQRQ